jgi:hypothetical protein
VELGVLVEGSGVKVESGEVLVGGWGESTTGSGVALALSETDSSLPHPATRRKERIRVREGDNFLAIIDSLSEEA